MERTKRMFPTPRILAQACLDWILLDIETGILEMALVTNRAVNIPKPDLARSTQNRIYLLGRE